MKIKTLLISLSVIGFLSFLLTSCSEEGEMGVGETTGETDPPRRAGQNTLIIDTIPFIQSDSITLFSGND